MLDTRPLEILEFIIQHLFMVVEDRPSTLLSSQASRPRVFNTNCMATINVQLIMVVVHKPYWCPLVRNLPIPLIQLISAHNYFCLDFSTKRILAKSNPFTIISLFLSTEPQQKHSKLRVFE